LNGLNKCTQLTAGNGFVQLRQIPVACSLCIIVERTVQHKGSVRQIYQCDDARFVLGNFLIVCINRCLILYGQFQQIFFGDVDAVLRLALSGSQTDLLLL
jgi:hypothetical protein